MRSNAGCGYVEVPCGVNMKKVAESRRKVEHMLAMEVMSNYGKNLATSTWEITGVSWVIHACSGTVGHLDDSEASARWLRLAHVRYKRASIGHVGDMELEFINVTCLPLSVNDFECTLKHVVRPVLNRPN